MSDLADYDKHTDDELQDGVAKAEQHIPRLEDEGKAEAAEAAGEQHDAMVDELQSRES